MVTATLRSPHVFFAWVGGVGGLLLVFLMPPFQSPDEPAHFFRAFAISQGDLLPVNRPEGTGSVLPQSLGHLTDVLHHQVTFHPESVFDWKRFQAADAIELRAAERQFQSYPTSAAYTPLPYLPQATGMALGRWLGARPLHLLYWGRLANLCAALAILYLALIQLPTLRWFSCVLALSPMAIFLRASLSADALAFALALLVSATVARLGLTNASQHPRDAWILIVGSSLLCLTKVPYIALVALGLVLLLLGRASRESHLRTVVAALAVSLLASVTTLGFGFHVEAPLSPRPDVDTHEQVGFVLDHPAAFAGIVVNDYLSRLPRYGAEFIGNLGWLDTPLPKPCLVAFALAWFVLFLNDVHAGVQFSFQQRLIFAGGALASALLISASLYAIWTPVAARSIEGIQGRYFYPVVAFAMWAGYSTRFACLTARSTVLIAKIAALGSFGVTMGILILRHYLP